MSALRKECGHVLQLLLPLLLMIGNSHTAAKRCMLFTKTSQQEAILSQHIDNEVCTQVHCIVVTALQHLLTLFGVPQSH
jgi:hypothetical protein